MRERLQPEYHLYVSRVWGRRVTYPLRILSR